MPEGHTVHRIARRFTKDFRSEAIAVSSPQGRFTDAGLISGRQLTKSEAWGKQLYLHFDDLVLRIHLGIYGKWSFESFASEPPEPRGQVRARFRTSSLVADLRGPTACELLDNAGVAESISRLGPDPLRPDPKGAEGRRFLEKVASSKRPIGQLLMDQSILAGVGNVYRAELLFRAALSPFTPGQLLASEQVSNLWDDSRLLMPIGVRTGLMLTRNEFLSGRPKLSDRYYVYKRAGEPCRKCGNPIAMELMASRKLYWCPKCQK